MVLEQGDHVLEIYWSFWIKLMGGSRGGGKYSVLRLCKSIQHSPTPEVTYKIG